MEIYELAGQLAEGFEYVTNEHVTDKLVIKEDTPHRETLRSMVHQANDDLSWDFAYEAVYAALTHLSETQVTDLDDWETFEFADSHVDVYNMDRIKWLYDGGLVHMTLCDEAMEAIGSDQESLDSILGLGQHYGYELAAQAVINNWPEQDDDEDWDDAQEEGEDDDEDVDEA